jgi:two-component system, sensor histidine kinase and response regulator
MNFFDLHQYPNLNKRVSPKTFIICFMPTMLLVGVSFFLLCLSEIESARNELKRNHDLILSKEEEFTSKTIDNVIHDLQFITAQNELKKLLQVEDFYNESSHQIKLDVINEYIILNRQNQMYDQIRLFDVNGQEFIKLYRLGNSIFSAFPSQMANYRDKYWFKEGLKLGKKEIFISPIDLKIDGNKLSIPLTPTIRFMTPLFDSQGKKKGLIVINYLAENIIRSINLINTSNESQILIINEDGFWLQGIKNEDEWGFMIEERKNNTFQMNFPQTWQKIQNKQRGYIKTKEGLFSFIKVDIASNKSSLSYPIYSLPKSGLIILIWVSPEMLQKNQQIISEKYLGLYGFSTLIIAFASGVIASIQYQKQKVQEKLKQSEAKYRQIIETAEEGICIVDTDNLITLVNPKLAKMLGYFSGDLLNKSILNFISDDDQDLIKSNLKTCRYGKKNTFELKFNLTEENYLWAIVSISSIFNITGKYTGILIMVTDISDRHQYEIELHQAKEIAEKASQVKSQFISNISHELRTPLNGILGYAQILKNDDNLDEEQKKELDTIKDCGLHLLNLIDDLISLSKLEGDKIALNPHELNLPNFLDSLVEITSMKAKHKGIKFNYQFSKALPWIIYADEKYLRQILLNLLGNAVKFTHQGEVTFQVDLVSSCVSANNYALIPLTNCLRFLIKDTGIGIAQENLENIFLPFKQIGKNLSQSDGAGLGLTISQKLATIIHSEIKVKSNLGKGSIFWFEAKFPVIALSSNKFILSKHPENSENLQLDQNYSAKLSIFDYEKTFPSPPSLEILKTLYDLAKKGLLDDLQQKVTHLQENDPTYLPFCQEILALSKEFKIKQIRELLKQYVEKIKE